ncbi:MAG: hypothetical protein H0X36_14110 [Sphingomonadaceae bacterium]|nr:hypothetical protein [Sphingomonadaceae bacterium]
MESPVAYLRSASAPLSVAMPRRGDGVGSALRDAFGEPARQLPAAMADLLRLIDCAGEFSAPC